MRARIATPPARPASHLLHYEESDVILNAAIEVQRILGVGLLERTYQTALALELTLRKVTVTLEVPFAAMYKGNTVGQQRVDLLVQFPASESFGVDRLTGELADGPYDSEARTTAIVVECKHFRGDESLPRALAMLGSYVQLAKADLGLLLNFGERPLGIRRVLPHPNPAA